MELMQKNHRIYSAIHKAQRIFHCIIDIDVISFTIFFYKIKFAPTGRIRYILKSRKLPSFLEISGQFQNIKLLDYFRRFRNSSRYIYSKKKFYLTQSIIIRLIIRELNKSITFLRIVTFILTC